MARIFSILLALSAVATLRAAAGIEADEFAELQRQIASSPHWNQARLARETCRPEALILPEDRTPVEVVWRRTWALARHLRCLPEAPDLSQEMAALELLRPAVEALGAASPPPQPRPDDASPSGAAKPSLPLMPPTAAKNSGSAGTTDASLAAQRTLFAQLVALRRRIAFRNPLLDFQSILFLTHNKQVRGYRHMVDQYLGFNAEKAGGVCVLEQAFDDRPRVRSLLAASPVREGRLKGRILDQRGAFISLDLDYDAQTILFAFSEAEHQVPAGASFAEQYWRQEDIPRDKGAAHHFFRPESTYHVFRARTDGSDLRQLTDGLWNDYDPCFLPNDRIAFISERAGGQVRCGMRPLPTATLHAMMPDGSDVIQLSWHDTQEWHPSVDNNGLLAYTRWDYIDRDSDVAQHLWLCHPDGRDPRSPHGNYPERRELRPWMEMSIRAIPGSHRYVAVAAPHHGEAYGSIVLIDPRLQDDRAAAQLRRVTPEVLWPESESAPGVPHDKGRHSPAGEVYGTPWPLSEDFFLCVYDSGQRHYGLYLLDTFGNRELIYRDPALACLDPIPLRPRRRPPILPTATLQAKADRDRTGPASSSSATAPLRSPSSPEAATPFPPDSELAYGTVAVLNVYESELPWPAGVKIKSLRVVNIFPKDNPFQDDPNIGVAAQSLCRGVLGTVPVEADGSVHFRLPAGAPVYFQLLDETGLAIQTMRSDTYVHPGERLTCVGCHEHKHLSLNRLAVAASTASPQTPQPHLPPLALRRPPSTLQPEPEGAYPLTFARLVQPVLDAKCLGCHNQQPKAPSLHGDRFGKFGWSEAFATLSRRAWGRSGGNGIALKEPQFSIPGQEGARVSRLYRMLSQNHHDVTLSASEWRRLTLWLDCNSNFYGAYTDPDQQARGQVVKPRWGIPLWIDFETLANPKGRMLGHQEGTDGVGLVR